MLAHGRADYLLMIDADETLEITDGVEMSRLSADSYDIEVRCGGFSCARKQLLRNSLHWHYEGVLHEHACCDEARSEEFLPGLWIESYRDGAWARDPETYFRDAQTLERALRDEPNNARYVFYLAQTYILLKGLLIWLCVTTGGESRWAVGTMRSGSQCIRSLGSSGPRRSHGLK